jgi:hypothetical protein
MPTATFTSAGGTLQLDSSRLFAGTVAGFASTPGVIEQIDLRDFASDANTQVSFKEAKDGTEGTLTIKNGKDSVNLTLLGQYTAADFNIASDGAGGTVVTDSGLGATAAATPLAAVTSGTA